jgi:hypothetical protein
MPKLVGQWWYCEVFHVFVKKKNNDRERGGTGGAREKG